MFLKVIWNKLLQQSSLYVSEPDSHLIIENQFQDFEVVISLPLKQNISINFVQNFIAFNEFNISYLDNKLFWLENISLTKNILAFFNAINLISLQYNDLLNIDKFCLLNNIPLNDCKNLSFQSPVKTIPRDLSSKPNFMNHFINIGDFSKNLLRTTFYFSENKILLYINKRIVKPEGFFNHLNSNRDRIRINESLSQPFNDTLGLIDFFSELAIYKSLKTSSVEFEYKEEKQKLFKNNNIKLPFINFLNSLNIAEENNITLDTNYSNFEEDLTEDFIVSIEQTIISDNKIINDLFKDDSTNLDFHAVDSLSVEDLVDSINDIIEETFDLELDYIIELPIILFLSEPIIKSNDTDKNIKEILLDDFIDDFFLKNDSNLEINDFSAKEVIDIVTTQVSIFENNSSIIENNIANIPIEENIFQITSINDTTDLNNSVFHSLNNVLEKTNIIQIETKPFILFLDIKNNLLFDKKENICIINFLFSVNIVNELLEYSESEINFDFITENQKKLIELSMEGNIEGVIDLYNNYPDFEKPLIDFNYEGDNPLCIASFNENLELLSKLIEYGWNPNYFDSNLNNALIIACAEGHKNIVKYLLTHSLQINFQNKKGYTALHFAVNDCNHRIVKLLIDSGADIELSDNDRNTALSIAAFKGDINSTKLLLLTRINVHTKNKKGYDARAIALLAKNHAIAKLIEDKIISEKHNHSLPPIIEKNIE